MGTIGRCYLFYYNNDTLLSMTNINSVKVSVCCLGLSFLAMGCAKDAVEPKPAPPQPLPQPVEQPILPRQSGHIVALELSTQLDLNALVEADKPRALSFTMQEHTGEDPNVKEYRPRLSLQDPADGTELALPVYAIVAKKGEAKSVFTQELIFRKRRGENTVYYTGLASLPEGQSFEQGEWYMMLLANHNPESSRSQLAPSYTSRTVASYALPVVATYNDQPISLNLNVPYASEWFRIEASSEDSKRIVTNQTFVLKPEGILIQHELVGDLAEAHQLKAVGIRSNTLSFAGYYDVSPQTIISTLNQVSDTQHRILPTWVATPQKTFEMSRVWDNDTFGAADSFPWTMPSPKDTKYHSQQSSDVALSAATTQGDHSVQHLIPTRSQGQIPLAWDVRGRQYVFFWAMPQSPVAGEHPYTYIYADVMNDGEARQKTYTVNPETLQQKLNEAGQKQNEVLAQLNQAYYQAAALRYALNNNPSPTERTEYTQQLTDQESKLSRLEQEYKTSLQALYTAQTALSSFAQEYLDQVGLSRQSVLPIFASAAHSQADGTGLKSGRLYQSKGLITPDLLITELVYKTSNNKNYSLIELSNPAQSPRNLKDYALVRLKDTGNAYLYQAAHGGTTGSLAQAKLLPLADLLAHREDKTRYSPIAPVRSWAFSEGDVHKYPALPKLWWNSMDTPEGTMPLYSQQSILLGASGYIQDPVLEFNESSVSTYEGRNYPNYRARNAKPWFVQWLGTDAYATASMPQITNAASLLALMQTARLRYMAAYDNGSRPGAGDATLDLQRTEGIALVKKTSSGAWQLIDSSVPIGVRAWASSMSYRGYKDLIRTQNGDFSLQRQEYVQFPCLPPYRSAQVAGKGSEWVARAISQHTLGHRGKTSSVRYQYDELWSLNYSLLSPNKTIRTPRIPVK